MAWHESDMLCYVFVILCINKSSCVKTYRYFTISGYVKSYDLVQSYYLHISEYFIEKKYSIFDVVFY